MSHTQFVQSFLDTIAARDWDALRAITTPDMKQQVLPYSLSQPEVDRETWITKLADTLAFVPDWKITLEGNVVGDDNGISFHASSRGMSTTGVPWRNEYIVMLRISHDASGLVKIHRMEEMVDSTLSIAFFTKHRAALAAQKSENKDGKEQESTTTTCRL